MVRLSDYQDAREDSRSGDNVYRGLWLGVLKQVYHDSRRALTRDMYERQCPEIRASYEARDWVIEAGEDYWEVCELAGWDGYQFRRDLIPIIKEAEKFDWMGPEEGRLFLEAKELRDLLSHAYSAVIRKSFKMMTERQRRDQSTPNIACYMAVREHFNFKDELYQTVYGLSAEELAWWPDIHADRIRSDFYYKKMYVRFSTCIAKKARLE